MKRPLAPLLILFVGFGFSLAANMLWTWPGGPVRILGGALASLALPGALHLLPQIPANGKWCWSRAVHVAAMTLIAAFAAITTFAHASALLIQHGEEPWLACLYPVMTELLVVMGVLVHHARPTGARPTGAHPPARTAERVPPQPVDPPVDKPRPRAKPKPTPSGRKPKVPVEQYARDHWPITAKQLIAQTGCADGSAYRVFNKLTEEEKARELEFVQ